MHGNICVLLKYYMNSYVEKKYILCPSAPQKSGSPDLPSSHSFQGDKYLLAISRLNYQTLF